MNLIAKGAKNPIRYWIVLLGAVGAALSVAGFVLWYVKLQRFLDEQTRVQTQTIVDQAQKRR